MGDGTWKRIKFIYVYIIHFRLFFQTNFANNNTSQKACLVAITFAFWLISNSCAHKFSLCLVITIYCQSCWARKVSLQNPSLISWSACFLYLTLLEKCWAIRQSMVDYPWMLMCSNGFACNLRHKSFYLLKKVCWIFQLELGSITAGHLAEVLYQKIWLFYRKKNHLWKTLQYQHNKCGHKFTCTLIAQVNSLPAENQLWLFKPPKILRAEIWTLCHVSFFRKRMCILPILIRVMWNCAVCWEARSLG